MMNLKDNVKEAKDRALEMLQNAEDKPQAILDAINEVLEVQFSEKIEEMKKIDEDYKANKDLAQRLGLRVLNAEEKKFYQVFSGDIKTAITTKQIDVIPTSIVDITLEYVRENSKLLQAGLVNLLPADVKKWLSAEKSGTFSWDELTAEIVKQLKGKINGINVELAKLSIYLVIPKAIRELSLPVIDKYFTAILTETLNEGVENGYLVGNGKNQPIGVYKMTEKTNEDGTHKDKEVNAGIKGFSPKQMAPVKVGLTNEGKRDIDKIFLICHPNDEANYVAPALYDKEGNMIGSYKNMEVITSSQNPQGKAAFTLAGKYSMGFSGFKITPYDQTLAIEDADLIIGKVYANGRAVDDSIAYVFDVTKLEEYIPEFIMVDREAGVADNTLAGA